jgi:hypothetical protein
MRMGSGEEELQSLYHSPNVVMLIKSNRLRWAGLVARVEESRSTSIILTGKPTAKKPLGRHRLDYNFRKELKVADINTRN